MTVDICMSPVRRRNAPCRQMHTHSVGHQSERVTGESACRVGDGRERTRGGAERSREERGETESRDENGETERVRDVISLLLVL